MNKFRLLYHIILVTKYRNNVFWSKGYFINSIGDASEETIRNYINNQG